MAVLRQANLLGQGRLDIPHIRAIESAVAADFDLLAGEIMAGRDPLVVHGFDVLTISPGSPVTSLQIRTASAVIIHPEASESGSIFKVPADRADETLNAANNRLTGSFTASTTNYIGIDLRRTADPTTADLVQFLDPDTNLEKPKTVPLARTLDYAFVVSTQDFSTTPGIAPLAKVVTDAFNNVVSIEDARNFLGRLGSGGAIPDTQHAYTWPGGRGEVGDNSDFAAGDKVISSLKEWMDAVMTRLWEEGGGEHWYSATADRNVKLLRTGTTFANGEWFEWDGTNLHWRNLTFLFDNSTAFVNEILDQLTDLPGLTDLADGECIYVDVDRAADKTGVDALQPVKSALTTLSFPTIPGSRFVIAWRRGSDVFTRDTSFPVGASFRVATDTITGIVQLTYAALDPTLPLVMAVDSNGGMHNDAVASSGGYGLQGTGDGVGNGVEGYGGTTNGSGVYGKGGATNGNGVSGEGSGTGAGVYGEGDLGSSAAANFGEAAGVVGQGVGDNNTVFASNGVYGKGADDTGKASGWPGAGVVGVGGDGGGTGVVGIHDGSETAEITPGNTGIWENMCGVYGRGAVGVFGEPTNAGSGGTIGVYGLTTAHNPANGVGVQGQCGTAGFAGVAGYGNGTKTGVYGRGGSSAGSVGVKGEVGGSTGNGGYFTGQGTASAGAGVYAQGGGAAPGVYGIGGSGTSGGIGVQGVGGATNGPGVLGTGGGAGAGGDFTGGTTGAAIETHASATTNIKPQVITRDTAGKMISGFGANGLLTGQWSEFREEWIYPLGASTTNGAQTLFPSSTLWSYYHAGSGGVVAGSGWDSDANFSYIQINGATVADGAVRSAIGIGNGLNGVLYTNNSTGITWMMEFPMAPTSAVTGADWRWGLVLLNDALIIGQGNNGIYFRKLTTDTNIQAVVDNGGGAGGSVHDTGVTLTGSNTFQTFRIEFYGSGTANGSCVKFFINGVLTNTVTNTIPTGISVGWSPCWSVTYNTNQRSMKVGPVICRWTRRLTQYEV